MIDFLFQMGVSNACLSLALAIVAMVVGAKAKRPHLAHILWLLVFVKLLTPPIVTIPLVTIPAQGETAVAINDHSRPAPLLSNSSELNIETSLWSKLGSAAWNHARVWLPPIWLLGSVVVFAWSLVRVCRFGRLLAAQSDAAPQQLQTAAVKIARRLELNTIPTICTTSARLSPMVWWTGEKVRIVIPTALLEKMDARQWQWVLAHELAHVRRRDYLVRWLEWLACVCFWWNPVVWWAQYNLRPTEEICCDALVVSCLNPKPKLYADSLLSAVEFLARPVLRLPAMASEINSGGYLERRFKMIVSEIPKRPNTRWLQVFVLLCAVVVLPLGIASAQDYKAVERRLGEAVTNGELSLEQAGVMMDVLRTAGGAKKQAAKSKSDTDLENAWKKLQAMVKASELTQEQATAKMSAIKKEAAKSKSDTDLESTWKKLQAMVKASELTQEQATAKMSAIKKEAAKKGIKERTVAGRDQRGSESITREDYARAEAEIRKAIAEGKITEEQGRAKLNALRQRMAMADQAVGGRGDDDIRARITQALMGNGIAREQVRGVIGTLRPIIGEIQSKGNVFKLDPGVRERLAGMGLTSEQIDFVVGLARRLANRPAN
jgi:beta-lactamase regulating signal transducer with metallopeptidase domain